MTSRLGFWVRASTWVKLWFWCAFYSSMVAWGLVLAIIAIATLNGGMVTITLNTWGEILLDVVFVPIAFILTLYAFWKVRKDGF